MHKKLGMYLFRSLNISIEYINKCHVYHQKWIENASKVLTLDGDKETFNEHLIQIKYFTCNHEWQDISAFEIQNNYREYQCKKCDLIR